MDRKIYFNNTSFELTKIWRFNECQLLQDAFKASNGEKLILQHMVA